MTLSFLDRFRPQAKPAPVQAFDGLAQVRAYWESLRKDGLLPSRAAIDPRGLSGVLDRVFLAERIGRGLVQVRIAGSGLADFAGMDLRGLPLSCLFAADSRPALGTALEAVLETPAVAELDLASDRAPGDGLLARLLLLPLAEDRFSRLVLGALSFQGKMPARCKLQIRGLREERLATAEVQTHVPPDAPPVEPIRRFGHLALVHSAE